MKLWILSDLHIEHGLPDLSNRPECDAIILAGDIGPGCSGVNWAIKKLPSHIPVYYLHGNHEGYYNNTYGIESDIVRTKLHAEKESSNVKVLNNEQLILGDYCFIFSTLWTDFNLMNQQQFAMMDAPRFMNDYRWLKNEDGSYIQPRDILSKHIKARRFIEQSLGENSDKKCVVVTHHLPSEKSCHPRFAGHYSNAYFASDLETVIEYHKPLLWVHGHTHASMDYKLFDTRIVCNPKGYPHEYTEFKKDFVVEI